jgi:hypothetical protein
VVIACADTPHPAYAPTPVSYVPRPISYTPRPAYKQPEYNKPDTYNFGYAVADDYSKVNFGQNEERNGYSTSGSYRVALPDGRTQIVTYSVADAQSGYIADVQYEGVAQYAAAPAYKAAPAPAYRPAPIYQA